MRMFSVRARQLHQGVIEPQNYGTEIAEVALFFISSVSCRLSFSSIFRTMGNCSETALYFSMALVSPDSIRLMIKVRPKIFARKIKKTDLENAELGEPVQKGRPLAFVVLFILRDGFQHPAAMLRLGLLRQSCIDYGVQGSIKIRLVEERGCDLSSFHRLEFLKRIRSGLAPLCRIPPQHPYSVDHHATSADGHAGGGGDEHPAIAVARVDHQAAQQGSQHATGVKSGHHHIGIDGAGGRRGAVVHGGGQQGIEQAQP